MPPPLIPGAEGLGVRRLTIAVLACLFAIWAGVTLADSPYMVFAALAGLLYLGTLAVNAKALAWLVIALQPAALIVPFFPGRPFWWELCALLAWPSLLVFFLVNRKKLAELKFDRWEKRALVALFAYIFLILMLMLRWGVGFRVLGGEQMGGRFYVQQVALAIVPLLILTAGFSSRRLLAAVAVGWVLALTYLVSDFTLSLGRGAMQPVLYFFEVPVDAVNFEIGYEVTGMRRYQSLWYVAAAGLSCLWTLVPFRAVFGQYALFAVPTMLGLLGLGLGSGHRTLFVLTVFTLFFLSLFHRIWTPLRTLSIVVFGVVGLAIFYAMADRLPLPVQRSISFLPGIEVNPLAERDAVETLSDRLGTLKLAIGDIPKYALVGRGFGMERIDQLPRDSVMDNVWIGYISGQFYNGTLGLLLKTGVPGLLLTSLFVFWVSRMAWETVRRIWLRHADEQDNFDRLSLLVCAQWFAAVVFFYLTHGDASLWVQVFGLPAALIMACRRQQLKRGELVSVAPQITAVVQSPG